jgi:hypothetical protein
MNALAPRAGLLLVTLAFLGCGKPASTAKIGQIEIRGTAPFVGQVSRALELIRQKAPEEFAAIEANVKRVLQQARSGMNNYTDPPTCELADPTTFYSITWCAGCIAHESHHAALFKQPGHVYGLAEEESACNAVQLKVMKLIGSPAEELSYLAAQDGSHFDLNGDGKYTQEDYGQRNW